MTQAVTAEGNRTHRRTLKCRDLVAYCNKTTACCNYSLNEGKQRAKSERQVCRPQPRTEHHRLAVSTTGSGEEY